MAKVRVKLNSAGVSALLNDPGVRSHLETLAARVAAAVSGGPPVRHGSVTTDRAVGRVWSISRYGMAAESRTGALARALDAAGGG